LRKRSASDDLMALAQARPEDRDATLLRAATALFCQEPIHDRDAVRRFEQLAVHLLPKLNESDRAYVASLLGGRRDAPVAVMRILARDAIGIAGPVLRHSPVLTTVDLLGVIAATGPDHHRLIASRPDLTADVLRALAIARKKYEETEELEAEAAPVEEIVTSADETMTDERPTEAIPQGSRFGAGPSFESFLDMPPEGRMRVLGEAAERRAPAQRARRPDQLLNAAFARAQIVAAARRGDRDQIIASFSSVLGINAVVATRMLDDPSGEPLMLMAKAAGLSDPDGRAVLLLANKQIGHSVDAFFRVADLYASLEAPVAEAFIDSWRGEPARKPAHVPVMVDAESRAAPVREAERAPSRPKEDRGRAAG